MTGTSSANPAKLAQFASDGMLLGNTLLGTARALRSAADDLVAAGESVPGLGTFVHDLEDLAYDWLHLDGFAGAVAEGFRAHLHRISGGFPVVDMVVDVGDATLAATAGLGYADRDEAIRAAEEITRRLEQLLGDDDASVADIGAILADAHRGRYDPAFAVTLSEALRVDGYVRLVGAIREVHGAESGSDGIDTALAHVAVLGTILTTALARTDPCADDTDPDDVALDRAFVDDLTHGYDPGNLTSGYEHTDLSVLVRHTDPPTDVAVAIANHRVSPVLESALYADLDEQVDLAWGDEHSGILGNYTRMLARDPDASAAWLDDDPSGVGGGTNLDLVLRQDGGRFVDDGAALARVVENGVTHDDFNTRRNLMRHAIEIVGADGDVLANRHMPEALARGVAADMALIDQQVNTGWSDPGLREPPANAVDTHEFLREVMLSDEAANEVYVALGDYCHEEVLAAPDHGADRLTSLRRVGALQGLVVAAETNAVQDAAVGHVERQGSRASAVNFLVGLAPYPDVVPIGALNDLADVGGGSVGHIAFTSDLEETASLSEGHERRRADEMVANNVVSLALAEGRDAAPELPAQEMTEGQLVEFLTWLDETYEHDEVLRRDRAQMTSAGAEARDRFRPL